MLTKIVEIITKKLVINIPLKKEVIFDEKETKLLSHEEYLFFYFGFDKKCFAYYNGKIYGKRYFTVTIFWITFGGGHAYVRELLR